MLCCHESRREQAQEYFWKKFGDCVKVSWRRKRRGRRPYGLLVGDALGVPYEFYEAEEIYE